MTLIYSQVLMLFLILESVVTDGGASEIWIIAGGGGLTEDLYGTFLSEDLSKSISPSAEKNGGNLQVLVPWKSPM